MNLKRWFTKHSLKLLAIRDTPNSIAAGVAIGIFFGFTPFWGLKTAMAMAVAWLTGSNILAAVIAVTMHDVVFFLVPMIMLCEYDIGYWLLSHPHHLPRASASDIVEQFHRSWKATFTTYGKPLLLGSFVFATPFSVVSYFITHSVVRRHQLKRDAKKVALEEHANPS
jgi:uncharacterized protein